MVLYSYVVGAIAAIGVCYKTLKSVSTRCRSVTELLVFVERDASALSITGFDADAKHVK